MLKKLWIAILAALLPLAAMASEFGTKEEAQAMAERAAALYQAEGLDALVSAVTDKSNKDFHDRDLYVLVYDTDGVNVAHGVNPALAGRNLMSLLDVEGKPLVRDMVETAVNQGQGWVDYVWQNPKTKAADRKSTYVIRVDDNLWVGVGAYAQ